MLMLTLTQTEAVSALVFILMMWVQEGNGYCDSVQDEFTKTVLEDVDIAKCDFCPLCMDFAKHFIIK